MFNAAGILASEAASLAVAVTGGDNVSSRAACFAFELTPPPCHQGRGAPCMQHIGAEALAMDCCAHLYSWASAEHVHLLVAAMHARLLLRWSLRSNCHSQLAKQAARGSCSGEVVSAAAQHALLLGGHSSGELQRTPCSTCCCCSCGLLSQYAVLAITCWHSCVKPWQQYARLLL